MAVRHGYGKIAGTDALVFAYDTGDTVNSYKGEPTVNILSSYVNPTFENGSKSADGWAIDAKTDGSYEYYSADSYSGNYSIKLTNSTVSAIAFWRIDIPVVSGVQYTVSVYAKNINCPTTPYFSGVNISGGAHSFTGISTTEWKRFTKTYTASSTGNAQFYIRTSNDATQGSFLIDNFQIEQKSHATPFVNGTRSTTEGLKDLTGNSTINLSTAGFDSSAQIDFDGTDDEITIPDSDLFDLTTNVSFEFVFKASSSQNNLYPRLIDKTSWLVHLTQTAPFGVFQNHNTSEGLRQTGTISSIIPADTWTHVVSNYDGQVGNIYINGERVRIRDFGSEFPCLTNNAVVTIGGNTGTTRQLNGKIAVAKIYNRALTAAEIKSNYSHYKTRFGI